MAKEKLTKESLNKYLGQLYCDYRFDGRSFGRFKRQFSEYEELIIGELLEDVARRIDAKFGDGEENG